MQSELVIWCQKCCNYLGYLNPGVEICSDCQYEEDKKEFLREQRAIDSLREKIEELSSRLSNLEQETAQLSSRVKEMQKDFAESIS
jgi:predicted  nucleic acid-binding Zn-ribbon protein